MLRQVQHRYGPVCSIGWRYIPATLLICTQTSYAAIHPLPDLDDRSRFMLVHLHFQPFMQTACLKKSDLQIRFPVTGGQVGINMHDTVV